MDTHGSGQLGAKTDFHEDLGAPTAVTEGERVDLDLIELAGAIKWFDVAKGYGFVVPDDGSPDLLLHVTTLRRCGFQSAQEGARVVCEAQRRAKGMQVFRVVAMDEVDGGASARSRRGPHACAGHAEPRLRDRHREVVQSRSGYRLS